MSAKRYAIHRLLIFPQPQPTDLGPVVADGVGKDVAIEVEGTGGDWLLHGLRRLEFGSSVFVPETVLPVATHCC